MVTVNGKNYELYDLDTVQSFIDRLASIQKTLPKYLYFLNGMPTIENLNSGTNIIVEDLLGYIKSKGGYDFPSVYEYFREKMMQNKLDIIKDILTPFIIYNSDLNTLRIVDEENETEYALVSLMPIDSNVKNMDVWGEGVSPPDVYAINREFVMKRNMFESNIRKNVKKSNDHLRIIRSFNDDIKVGIPYTDFQVETTDLEIGFKFNVSLVELFNLIRLNRDVPFASLNNFYKILKDYIPDIDMYELLSEPITLQVYNMKNRKNIKKSSYTYVRMLTYPDNVIMTVMKLVISKNNLTTDNMINRFLGVFGDESKIEEVSRVEQGVTGVFYFPKRKFNKHVLADLVLNNPLFSSLMYIDEHLQASNTRENSLLVHFNLESVGVVSARLTEQYMSKRDSTKDGGVFPINTIYVRVKISKSDNIKSVLKFQSILSKLMVVYDNEMGNIVNFYKMYYKKFGTDIKRTVVVENKSLKTIASDIFFPNYSTGCSKYPTIIDDDTAKEEIKAGKEVMVFPKTNEESLRRNYVCNYKVDKYPGLKVNTLDNKDKFPYVPCCYKTRHSDKAGSAYRYYYYDEPLPKDTDQQAPLKTFKVLNHNDWGDLPSNLLKLFYIADPISNISYRRKGVFRGKSSFLQCVIEAVNVDIPEGFGINNIGDMVNRERMMLLNDFFPYCCKQEMYDFTGEEIRKKILDLDVYLDPKKFIHLLELIYKVNIFIFVRGNNGELILPRYSQTYYKTLYKNPSVFILEHIGGTSERLSYPQCELIVKASYVEDIGSQYMFEYDNAVSKNVFRAFEGLRKSYCLDKEIPLTIFPLDRMVLRSQCIDTYGKMRMIKTLYKDKLITILTPPIQPVNLDIDCTIVNVELSVALQFVQELDGQITGKVLSGEFVKKIYVVLGNMSVSIPIEDSKDSLESVPEIMDSMLDAGDAGDVGDSVLSLYNKYKKLSRYIKEYMFWLYSSYIYLNRLLLIKDKDKTIYNFFENKIKVQSDFQYGNVGKTFSLNSGVMDRGKLVVTSDEMLKRLIYVLRLEVMRNPSKIDKYRNSVVIDNYYVDITDFDQYSEQVILEGDESVTSWINEKQINHNIQNKVVVGKYPYFFRNINVDNNIYLAQNCSTYSQGLDIGTQWFKNKINIGVSDKNIIGLGFTLFSYVNSDDISKHYINYSVGNNYDIKILGYKINDIPYYTVLLPLKNVVSK
jgi:hypothetical protein